MIRRPPRSTRTDTLFPYTTLFRSLLGAVAGYAGGWIERILTAFNDILLAFPGFLLALAIVAARGSSLERSEEHTSELQSLMRISYAVFCLKKKKKQPIFSDCLTIYLTHAAPRIMRYIDIYDT